MPRTLFGTEPWISPTRPRMPHASQAASSRSCRSVENRLVGTRCRDSDSSASRTPGNSRPRPITRSYAAKYARSIAAAGSVTP